VVNQKKRDRGEKKVGVWESKSQTHGRECLSSATCFSRIVDRGKGGEPVPQYEERIRRKKDFSGGGEEASAEKWGKHQC